ncbi:CocE/NonD family hydrolase [Mesorhizobium sp. M0815]|uniref:CocE/NonD family hydrolase n=1 Tax=Mesorhizobium sp. M0815 TaxID=2957005 RepID=UPI00333A1134
MDEMQSEGKKIKPRQRQLKYDAPAFAAVLAGEVSSPAIYSRTAINRATQLVTMRDGIRLATHLHLPPVTPAPCIAIRTPYGRGGYETIATTLCQRGYVVICQDVRGTGDSEPDTWDFYVYEWEDSFDFVDWITHQAWYNGFIGSLGGSYDGATQFCMAAHPKMTAIAPEVAGLGLAPSNGVRFHMYVNAYSRTVGKGEDKIPIPQAEMEARMQEETLATGYFDEPMDVPMPRSLREYCPSLMDIPLGKRKSWLWKHYNSLEPNGRAELLKAALGEDSIASDSTTRLNFLFGHEVDPDALLFPRKNARQLCQALHAPALFITGWYDWCLGDTLFSWEQLIQNSLTPVRTQSRLLITPSAHNVPGYHEGEEEIAALQRIYRKDPELLQFWYKAVLNGTVEEIPPVTYYLMGANEWRACSDWPPKEAEMRHLYLAPSGTLNWNTAAGSTASDSYIYDPDDPTPTMGGSILSDVYRPGSVDIAAVQQRPDVLTYTTAVLTDNLDVVGPITLVLYASSSAVETDFYGRISDVFPDGRAIQLQSGVLRTRYRGPDPAALRLGVVHRFEIDMWATANRFAAGHRLRLDVSSADFPKFQRNRNRGGTPGPSIKATQSVFHGGEHSSHLRIPVLS